MVVSVLMPTYNHERFIEQAILSFIQQQVDFDIELLIGDDCSSDNTSFIARIYAEKYPNKIHLFQYSVNRGLMHNYKYLLNQAKGKYIAILESDDIWLDPFKLHKQVEIIEKTPNCGLVFSNWIVIDADSKEVTRSQRTLKTIGYSDLLKGNMVAAVTVLFSRNMFDLYCDIDEYILRNFKTLDYPVWLSISAHSNIIYLDDYTAGYRCLSTSISNSNSYQRSMAFNQSIDAIVQYVVSKYGKGELTIKELENASKLRYLTQAFQFKKFSQAFSIAWTFHATNIKSFIIKVLPFIWLCKNRKLIGQRLK